MKKFVQFTDDHNEIETQRALSEFINVNAWLRNPDRAQVIQSIPKSGKNPVRAQQTDYDYIENCILSKGAVFDYAAAQNVRTILESALKEIKVRYAASDRDWPSQCPPAAYPEPGRLWWQDQQCRAEWLLTDWHKIACGFFETSLLQPH